MKKYLIIQTAFIGDVILASVLIETIKKNEPDAQIDFILKKGFESILENNPNLRKVYSFDKNHKIKSFFPLLKFIRHERYHCVFNVHRHMSSGLFTAFSKAKLKIGYKKNPLSFLFNKKVTHEFSKDIHEVDRILNLTNCLNFEKIRLPKLYFNNEQNNKVSSLKNKPYLCISPGSVWFTKRAPVSKWVDITKKHLSDTIYIIGGIEDQKIADDIIFNSSHTAIISLCGQLSLLESACLLKDAQHAYVNDSAPLHLCSATNTPVTALFCSTTPYFGFGPLSNESYILEVENLKCRPCGNHGKRKCPHNHFDCGNKIEII